MGEEEIKGESSNRKFEVSFGVDAGEGKQRVEKAATHPEVPRLIVFVFWESVEVAFQRSKRALHVKDERSAIV